VIGLRLATAILACTATSAVLALSAPGAAAHRDPCHTHHNCPSDHHTYTWQGLSCTSYAAERAQNDKTTVVVGGRRYWCHRVTSSPPPQPAPPKPSTTPTSVSTKTALVYLSRLPVRRSSSIAGYSRAQFGAAWEDVDQNGCDTREDILRRDLTRIVLREGSRCTVARGVLHDPYTRKTIRFVRGVRTSLAVQIDHVVALAAAWRTGAARWTYGKRLRYANDPVGLLAVDGPTNAAKGDDDASEWLPPNRGYDCTYAKRQITIKRKYGLWVTLSERRALRRVLVTICR
jgi:hypothetical protein